jgi:hypothetical protein
LPSYKIEFCTTKKRKERKIFSGGRFEGQKAGDFQKVGSSGVVGLVGSWEGEGTRISNTGKADLEP